ncbi:MAG: TIGR04086 family membrane protein [Ruminococcaceae bacterium]|nr:TIGR04086 family membrane protein [Oscillospiraceae bacterium]
MSSRKTHAVHAKRRSKTDRNPSPENAIKNYLRAFALTLAVGAFLIFIGSLGISFHADPARLIPPLAYALSILTALIGGCLSGKIHKRAPLTVGLVNGGLLLLAMLIGSLCFHGMEGHLSQLASILLHTAIPVASVTGAVLGNR